MKLESRTMKLEFISRRGAIRAIRDAAAMGTGFPGAYKNINMLPAADVAPITRGHWENIKSPWAEGGYLLVCSNCRQRIASLSGKLNYCPNCGALMRDHMLVRRIDNA